MKMSPIVKSAKAVHPKNPFLVEIACDTIPDESAIRNRIPETMLRWIRSTHCELARLSRVASSITAYRKLAVVSEKPSKMAE